MRCLPNPIFTLLCLFAIANCQAGLSAADVEVRLNDGRTLRGTVNENQTTKELLALEYRSSGLVIQRKLSWGQIADVRVTPRHNRLVTHVEQPKSVTEELVGPDSEPPPLKQLLVDAKPVSTTGKMDWDSLRVTLRGIDMNGESVPLSGTVKVLLWGQRQASPESNYMRHPFVTPANFGSRFLDAPSNSSAYQHPFVTAPNPVVELASWTQSIKSPQDDTFVLSLPNPLPEHDVRVGAFGEVTVELLMPGVGVFEASAPDVVLSHQTLLRRERLDRNGSRFFPSDSTTDSPQTTRSRNRFTWPGGVSGPDRGVLPIQP